MDTLLVETIDQPVAAQSADSGHEVADQPFRELFLRHYARVLAVLMRVIGSRAEAEELADDVFLKFYRHFAPRWAATNPGGWLYRTATRAGLDALRARARRQKYENEAARLTPAISEEDASDSVLRDERRRLVQRTLARLKPVQAQILLLRHAGFSYQEIAEALKLKPSSVGTMLARAEAQFAVLYRKAAEPLRG